jgi:hypothetical protein
VDLFCHSRRQLSGLNRTNLASDTKTHSKFLQKQNQEKVAKSQAGKTQSKIMATNP